jgi:DNA-binding FadR family transcriptional regulator
MAHGSQHLRARHATDHVFRVLATEILKGELKANVPMPTENALAERFGVSRIVVREALHRLKEYELVLVHQGRRTMVLHPERATNARLLDLESEIMSSNIDWVAAFTERQIHSAAGMLALAELRIEPQQLALLVTITEQLAQVPTPDVDDDLFKYTRAYWMTIALSTKNPLYLRDTAWHFKVLQRHTLFRTISTWPPEQRVACYRRLNGKLRDRQGAAAAYLEMVREVLAQADTASRSRHRRRRGTDWKHDTGESKASDGSGEIAHLAG